MEREIMTIEADVALIDIDGTITASRRESDFAVSPLEHLAALLMQRNSVSREEALARIRSAGDVETSCLGNFLETLDIPVDLYWHELRADIEQGITIPEDAVFFIKELKNKNIRLFSATTNSRMVTLLKLSVGGLGDIDGSPYFDGFFGGDTFGDPQGKFSPQFFPSILKSGGFDLARTLMIGDDLKWDMRYALEAGIAHVAIINRQQTRPLLLKDGAMFVNSLKVIYNMIEPVAPLEPAVRN